MFIYVILRGPGKEATEAVGLLNMPKTSKLRDKACRGGGRRGVSRNLPLRFGVLGVWVFVGFNAAGFRFEGFGV